MQVAEFINYLFRPAVIKLCKALGANTTAADATRMFTFNIALADPLVSRPLTQTSVNIQAGHCVFLNGPFAPVPAFDPTIGTFNVNTRLIITEVVSTGFTQAHAARRRRRRPPSARRVMSLCRSKPFSNDALLTKRKRGPSRIRASFYFFLRVFCETVLLMSRSARPARRSDLRRIRAKLAKRDGGPGWIRTSGLPLRSWKARFGFGWMRLDKPVFIGLSPAGYLARAGWFWLIGR
ncbi:MAG: hypothetical protein ACK4S4_11265 [Pyrinomonadaceae bacterium]